MDKDLIFNKDAFNDIPEYCEQTVYLKKGRVLGIPYDMENLQLEYTYLGKKIIINIIADTVDKSVIPDTVTVSKTLGVKICDEKEELSWYDAMAKFDNNPESEWRLPTMAEIHTMHEDSGVTGFSQGWYATSTEMSCRGIYAFDLYDKEHMNGDRDESYLIRLVKK